MKKALLSLLLLVLMFYTKASIITKVFTRSGYGSYNVMIYTPDNTTGKLPAVIFFPGSGESTRNVNDLYTNGPLHFIQAGWKPSFIVIGVQPPNGVPGTPDMVENSLDSLFNPIYRIDTTKFYLTGLSYGCATLQGFIQGQASPFHQPTAIVPMSYDITAQCGDFYAKTDYLCGTDLRFQDIPVWGFCGNSDSFLDKMKRFYDLCAAAGYTEKFTTFIGGHCCWNTFYDPTYRENGMNIYDWLLQFPTEPLPLTWGYFRYNDIAIQLEWSTLTESNIDHFDIEESDNGILFEKVGEVSTTDNSNGSSYIFKL